MHQTSRRTFIKRTAAGMAGAALAWPASSYSRILGANDQIRLGIIGMGRQAREHLRQFNQESGASVVAVAEVYAPNVAWAKRVAPDLDVYSDLRSLIERSDIDAVV